jgi:hypothetical protein
MSIDKILYSETEEVVVAMGGVVTPPTTPLDS